VCSPEIYPDELLSHRRLHDRHYARRFDLDWAIRMFRAGEPLHDCVECVAGPDGWAVVHTYDELGKVHYCACGSWRLCATVLRGDIQVVAMLEPLSETG
jgi:hypothetical protein